MKSAPLTAGPPALALARAVPKIPALDALPGGSMYEPKWDGYRIVISSAEDATTLWSRQGKDLTRYFPDLAAAAEDQIPPGFIVDGEAVIWTDGRLDFEALQKRLTTSKKNLAALVSERPATFVAFDLLQAAGTDTRGLALRDRRELLEELASWWEPPLDLSPVTTDLAKATIWFETMPATGVEGLVIKGADQEYQGGERQWLKVKHRETLDVVCAAVIGPINRPEMVVAGLPIGGELRIVGRTSLLKGQTSRALAAHLKPGRTDHPWPAEVKSGAIDRFNSTSSTTALTLVEPMVVEVSADTAFSGSSFRHALRYKRARPELDPADVAVPGHLVLNP
ncbi:ATP-dependent DNA ligase [uncultured Arthrobacter sp.]|uniref:ATP-dependent DNA ligase n=1 Tax=uncultured Arthrobacter sp. TaxID=114050 RepID=UPI00262FD795|nr:ATP-dependent DNA ligase [uncultured Arthrobacter sp.]